MTRRLTIIGLVAAALVFVNTLTGPPDTASQWPPIAFAVINAAGTFVWIWFFAPLFVWLASVVMSRLRRALERAVRQSR